jgi:hypothetical protein
MLPILPIEIINKILIIREPHPVAKIIKNLNNLLKGRIIYIYDFECGSVENGKRKRKMPQVIMTYCFYKLLII